MNTSGFIKAQKRFVEAFSCDFINEMMGPVVWPEWENGPDSDVGWLKEVTVERGTVFRDFLLSDVFMENSSYCLGDPWRDEFRIRGQEAFVRRWRKFVKDWNSAHPDAIPAAMMPESAMEPGGPYREGFVLNSSERPSHVYDAADCETVMCRAALDFVSKNAPEAYGEFLDSEDGDESSPQFGCRIRLAMRRKDDENLDFEIRLNSDFPDFPDMSDRIVERFEIPVDGFMRIWSPGKTDVSDVALMRKLGFSNWDIRCGLTAEDDSKMTDFAGGLFRVFCRRQDCLPYPETSGADITDADIGRLNTECGCRHAETCGMSA